MDRSTTSAPDSSATMRTARCASLDLLSPATAGERGEPASAPAPRRAVLALPVFRQPSHGRDAEGQPQTHPAADAHSGHRSALPETELEPSGARSRDLPVPAARRLHRTAQPGLEHRYYVCSDAWRLPLPGCRDGLVQPLRAQLGTFQYDGDRFLSGRVGGSIPLRPSSTSRSKHGHAGLARKPATLELHPFLHRAPEISSPTSIVFDHDPGEGTNLSCSTFEVAIHNTRRWTRAASVLCADAEDS